MAMNDCPATNIVSVSPLDSGPIRGIQGVWDAQRLSVWTVLELQNPNPYRDPPIPSELFAVYNRWNGPIPKRW